MMAMPAGKRGERRGEEMEGGGNRELGLESVCSDMRKAPPTAPNISISKLQTKRTRKKPAKTHKNGGGSYEMNKDAKGKMEGFFCGGGLAKNGFLIHACLLRSRGRTKDLFILLYLRAGWRKGGISKP